MDDVTLPPDHTPTSSGSPLSSTVSVNSSGLPEWPEFEDVPLDESSLRTSELNFRKKVASTLGEIASQNRRILEYLADRATFDKAREMSVETMNRELQEYRRTGVDLWKRELLLGLLLLYDNMTDCVARSEAEGTVASEVNWLSDILLETLYRQGVEPMTIDGGHLDRERHKIIRSVAATSPNEHLTVDRILKRGFLWRGAVLRPEQIVIRRFDQPLSEL